MVDEDYKAPAEGNEWFARGPHEWQPDRSCLPLSATFNLAPSDDRRIKALERAASAAADLLAVRFASEYVVLHSELREALAALPSTSSVSKKKEV